MEVEGFADRHFADDDRVAVPVDSYGSWCGPTFWEGVTGVTFAIRKDGSGSTGIVVDNGTLYYWDVSL